MSPKKDWVETRSEVEQVIFSFDMFIGQRLGSTQTRACYVSTLRSALGKDRTEMPSWDEILENVQLWSDGRKATFRVVWRHLMNQWGENKSPLFDKYRDSHTEKTPFAVIHAAREFIKAFGIRYVIDGTWANVSDGVDAEGQPCLSLFEKAVTTPSVLSARSILFDWSVPPNTVPDNFPIFSRHKHSEEGMQRDLIIHELGRLGWFEKAERRSRPARQLIEESILALLENAENIETDEGVEFLLLLRNRRPELFEVIHDRG